MREGGRHKDSRNGTSEYKGFRGLGPGVSRGLFMGFVGRTRERDGDEGINGIRPEDLGVRSRAYGESSLSVLAHCSATYLRLWSGVDSLYEARVRNSILKEKG